MLDRIALITGNDGKAAEYAAMLGIDVTPAKAELTEVQSLDVAAVAARKAADADVVQVFTGTVGGSLATEPRGTFGFGYDAIFVPDTDPGHRTYAQMTSEEKNKISHRRYAVHALRDGLGLR